MTIYYYSAASKGFHTAEENPSLFDGEGQPIGLIADARPVTDARHAELVAGNETGRSIIPDENGDPVLSTPEPPTTAELLANITNALQAHLDATARAAGYDSISSAISYADEPAVLKFQQEGQAFRAWRSLFWAAANQIKAEVEAGTRSIPTTSELIAELPTLPLP